MAKLHNCYLKFAFEIVHGHDHAWLTNPKGKNMSSYKHSRFIVHNRVRMQTWRARDPVSTFVPPGYVGPAI